MDQIFWIWALVGKRSLVFYILSFSISQLVFGYLTEFWKHVTYIIFPLWTIHLPIEEKPNLSPSSFHYFILRT